MYTIICHDHKYGHIEIQVTKEEVLKECERLRKVFSNRLVNNYVRIEVTNNETGEIREYWNNSTNTLRF